MHYMNFKKATMQRFTDAIRDGKPFVPTSAEGWTQDDMAHALGALLAGMMSHGPVTLPTDIGDFGKGELADAMKEQTEEQFYADLAVTGMYAANLAFAVVDGQLPDDFADSEHLVIEAQGALPDATAKRIARR